MKMQRRRRAYYSEAIHSTSVIWSRWKRKILARLPADVIQSLAAKGRSDRWIAGWATQPRVWLKGWSPPVEMRNPDSIRFAAARSHASWDERDGPAVPTALDEWSDVQHAS